MSSFNFISASTLIASIQEDLSSYDANNQIDPGRWYPWIQKVISDLGISCYEYKHELVYIRNHKGQIDHCGFYVLDSAFLVRQHCVGGNAPEEGPLNYQGRSIIWDDTTSACAFPAEGCNDDFRTCQLNSFNEVTVREYVRGLPYNYQVPILYPLSINQRVSKGWCLPSSVCFGSQSKEEITIHKGEIYTNFSEGIVLLNYYVFPYGDDGLPEIPDHPKIKLALEHYIKWKVFEKMWIDNDDMNVQNKMQYYKREYETNSYADAEYFVKLTDFDAIIDIARNYRKRFNVLQLLQK